VHELLVNRVLSLHEELRRTRALLAHYRELLFNLQQSVLPHALPDVPGLDLAAHFAEAEEVGGDFYDVRWVRDNTWAFAVADVSGHGPTAAVVMTLTHALGTASQNLGLAPGAGLQLINRELATRYLATTGQYVTVFVAYYDTARCILRYACAGHPPARLVRGGRVCRLDAVGGLPLGISATSAYEEAITPLQPDDRLVLFTDGITETMNAQHEPFGDARFAAVLTRPTTSAAHLVRCLTAELQRFRSGEPVADDETCLVAALR